MSRCWLRFINRNGKKEGTVADYVDQKLALAKKSPQGNVFFFTDIRLDLVKMFCWGRKALCALDESSLRSLEESHGVESLDDPHTRVQAWVNESADFRSKSFGSFFRRMKKLRLFVYSERQTKYRERLGFEGWIPNRASECWSSSYSDF